MAISDTSEAPRVRQEGASVTEADGAPIRTATVVVQCRLGLHLRSAARFIEFAKQFRSTIQMQRGAIVVDGKSILGLLLLGASWGTTLQVEARGDDADRAIEAIAAHFKNRIACADDASLGGPDAERAQNPIAGRSPG
jgi:phosphocarrier protein